MKIWVEWCCVICRCRVTTGTFLAMRSWRAILDGAEREAALASVRAIAAALDRDHDTWPLSSGDEGSSRTPGLADLRRASLVSGPAGLALFYGHVARAGLYEPAGARAFELLNRAIDQLLEVPMDASLHGGVTGVAWVADRLPRLWEEEPDPELNEQVDQLVLDSLAEDGMVAPYDLVDGLVGIGLYGLSRLPETAGLQCVQRVLELLEARAVRQEIGRAWPSGVLVPGTDSPEARDSNRASGSESIDDPRPYNLGLAHGVPGVVGFLATLVRRDIEAPRAGRLLDDGMDWLLAQQLDDEQPSAFPTHVGPLVREPGPARTAWCYGDPGIASVVLQAARVTGREDWRVAALAVAHRAARRPLSDTGVVDSGLCHGAAGISLIYQQIAQATGDPVCRDAARTWLARCSTIASGLEARIGPRSDDGIARDIAGFTTFSFERVTSGEYIADPCWLTGAAGVGLTLLAAATDHAPSWSQLLLIDVP